VVVGLAVVIFWRDCCGFALHVFVSKALIFKRAKVQRIIGYNAGACLHSNSDCMIPRTQEPCSIAQEKKIWHNHLASSLTGNTARFTLTLSLATDV
jgi:hypothetical protein